MSWKTALYNYIHAKNQAELEGSAALLDAYVSDHDFVRKQDLRIRRLRDSFLERDARLLRGETKLRLQGAKESPWGIVADVRLHRFLDYRIGSAEGREERIETERVRIERRDGGWLVHNAEALQGERGRSGRADGIQIPVYDPFGSPQRTAPSVPYIHPSIRNSRAQESATRKTIYNRPRAVQYAETWWQTPNPRYEYFEVDCTNFVSQCLFAGGAPMDYTGKRDSGWWYAGKNGGQEQWSYSWAVANSLHAFFVHSAHKTHGLRGTEVEDPRELQPGDTISYDWDGDGRFQHNTFVIGKDANGMPLVNAHTFNSRNRYWAYKDSPAWTERTKYVFIHVADEM
ncbi:amidase domain-containing protein [Paenibacillus whitsoniae]|uniref:Putative amidase domain-containing protein n=1 Tax=Paenibacillus whitsoniae TaxID=2496558 RepID=A0A430J839_9BACL|nr:amidase domain-containing protein [Paenibacillus whitsoniae]RTE05839.1 hypothetical protein EJQ19_24235 [Paenibacillus whitsoniae]